MSNVSVKKILDVIPNREIIEYLGAASKGAHSQDNPLWLPSAPELLMIYYRDGPEGINDLVHREIHRQTGVNTNG